MHIRPLISLVWLAIILSMGFGLAGCFSGKNASTEPEITAAVNDGFYKVLNETEKKESARYGGIVVAYSHEFLGEKEEVFYIEIDTSFFIPLELIEKPDSLRQKDQRINLLLTLTPEASESLETFTGNNIMKQVAIVVGGKAVTKHKIREKITGGKIQVTRCTDRACEYLYYELQDNVKTKKGDP